MTTNDRYNTLSDDQRRFFDSNGYLIIENALSSQMVATLNGAVDEIYQRHKESDALRDGGKLNLRNCITHHHAFLDLLDWPETVPLAWGVLNWNIQMLTSHLIVLPAQEEPSEEEKRKHQMHRDGGTSDVEMEEPHPRIMLKIAYVLNDQTDPRCGATRLVPGSNRLVGRPSIDEMTCWPIGTISLNLPAGTAFMFEQRTYHSVDKNWSDHDRRTIFMGYGYRWVKPMDYITMPSELIARCNPIQKQLVGVVNDVISYYLPEEGDVPIKKLIDGGQK